MRGERIEWEEIARRKEIAQALDIAIGGRADCSGSAEVNRDWLRYIAALEAGEAMARVMKLLDDLGGLGFDKHRWIREALADFRQHVAPRARP